jgi:HK97 family phage major capsid protein
MVAMTRHIDSGGRGPVPEDAIRAVELEFSAEIAADREARAAALENEKLSTPEPRRAPAMQPLNGGLPTDNQRAARPASEVRQVTSQDGRTHRIFNRDQRISDYEESKSPIDLNTYFDVVIARACGNHARFAVETRELGENINTAGGHLVPHVLAPGIIDDVRAANRIFQAGAKTMEMSSDVVTMARIESDMVPTQKGENVALDFSDGTFSAVNLRAKKIGVVTSISKELAEDGIGVGEIVRQQLTSAMAQAIDDIALNGSIGSTGTTFMGLMENPLIGEQAAIAGNLTWDHWLDAMYQIEALNSSATSVICHPQMLNFLRKLKSATDEIYLAPPSAIDALQVLPTTKIATGSAIFGAFERLVVGIRRDVLIEVTDQAGDSFAKDQLWIKATCRLDTAVTQPLFYRLAGATYS